MFFRASYRNNPKTQKNEAYFRLVESYRDAFGHIKQITVLTAGFIDNFTGKELEFVQTYINETLNGKVNLFIKDSDTYLVEYANELLKRIVESRKDDSDKGLEKVYLQTLKHDEVREIGAEWLGFQVLNQLKLKPFLENQGWETEKIQLAFTQIISRAVYPASESKTSRWIKENSSVCELTSYPIEKMTKDKLYKSALDLYKIKDEMEQFLSSKTDELFDIQDTIYLYDLTNTYFEGEKKNSKLAQFGRSKEKRSDAKLVVLAVVVNLEGFIKYSSILQGNMADSATLSEMVENLKVKSGTANSKSLLVFDAGIVSEENLAMVVSKGYDYVCVNRTKPKEYALKNDIPVIIYDSKNQKISLNEVTLNSSQTENQDFNLYKVKSDFKAMKEHSMNVKFQERFLGEMQKLSNGLSKKSGIKTLEKVQQKIGRLTERYPSIESNYAITCLADKDNKNAESLTWELNKNAQKKKEEQGVYFLRTSLKDKDEETIWRIYNALREIETTFRTLKTDLDLRPIYHKTDDATMAHLNLGLLAYWIVNTIRHQLKIKKIKHDWREIIRISNTQKMVKSSVINNEEDKIVIIKCSEPTEKLMEIYSALKYKSIPFRMKKFVVPKTEFKTHEHLVYKEFSC